MISARSSLFSLTFGALVLLFARPAEAQLHWDANVQGGYAHRFFSGSSKSAGVSGSNAPLAGVEGHIALLPLLRVGAYFDYESASTGEPKPPQVMSFGARLKFTVPGNRNNVHLWLFTGFGGVAWQAPGYQLAVDVPLQGGGLTPATANVQSASGTFFEVPLGIGAGWRFRHPWELLAELQGRFGFGMNGSYFTDDHTGNGLTRPATLTNSGLAPAIPTGSDVFAILLTVGIGLDE